MLFPHSKILFRIEFKRDNFSMKTTRLELYHGSFVNDLIQILSLLLQKIVKWLLTSVSTRTRTIKYVRQNLCISTTMAPKELQHILKFSFLTRYCTIQFFSPIASGASPRRGQGGIRHPQSCFRAITHFVQIRPENLFENFTPPLPQCLYPS